LSSQTVDLDTTYRVMNRCPLFVAPCDRSLSLLQTIKCGISTTCIYINHVVLKSDNLQNSAISSDIG